MGSGNGKRPAEGESARIPRVSEAAAATDANRFARATFEGCAANIAPLIGVELTLAETSVETAEESPEGDLAVLPSGLEVDGAALGSLTLYFPLAAAATLARRMLGDAEPEKERALAADELDAVGKVLNLCSGAIDASLRAHVNPGALARPLPWWRTAEPGSNTFEPGSRVLARSELLVPGGSAIPIFLRFPRTLLAETSVAQVSQLEGIVLLLGLDADACEGLAPVLASARFEVRKQPLDAPDRGEAAAAATAVFLPGDAALALAACRQLRLANDTWRTPTIVCMKEPTKQRVIDAVAHGANHVLRIPADALTVLRVMKLARE